MTSVRSVLMAATSLGCFCAGVERKYGCEGLVKGETPHGGQARLREELGRCSD
jgi:hypothetical protein